MKFIISLLLFASLAVQNGIAERLPLLSSKDWTSYHVVSKSRQHAVGICYDGSIDFYFLKRGKKDNIRWPVEMKVRVERRSEPVKGKPEKWVNKKINKNGFVSPSKASEEVDSLTLVGIVTGGIKFQIDIKFTKSGLQLSGKVLNDADQGDYRMVLESNIGKLSTVSSADSKDADRVKDKTKGAELKFATRHSKLIKMKFYEVLDPKLLDKAEITSLELKARKIGRKKLTWSLVNPDLGKLTVVSKADNGMPYAGFTVTNILSDENGNRLSDGVLLEYQ